MSNTPPGKAAVHKVPDHTLRVNYLVGWGSPDATRYSGKNR